ncbi:Coiled-coil-helix-coiled-coil-helix domain-containing protein 2 [Halotydeus destructor]|nr:Coiled-coil-helix-coiled-coil-helix domain-containing protein 2 [Halotydeus destructor]
MPRRSSGRSASPSRRAAPARPAPPPMAARPTQPAVVQPAPSAVGAPMQQGPGLMAQMAATAGGVAIGSAVGHTIGHAITGGFSGNSEPAPAAPAQPMQPQQQYGQANQGQSQCQAEFKSFLECTQQQADLSLCEGFNHVLRECKNQYAQY